MEIQVAETKFIDFLNICRICLKKSTNIKTSIFSEIEIQRFNQKDEVNSCFERVIDIILYCASNISVNINMELKKMNKNLKLFNDHW